MILMDNDAALCNKEFHAFTHERRVHLRFRCAYVPAGNVIAERCDLTVKRIAAKMRYPIQEAVYWYKITPRDDVLPSTAPGNRIYRYKVRVKGLDTLMTSSDPKNSFYQIEDCEWVKTPHNRCTTKFNRGRVAGVICSQSLLVDGIARHVRYLRPCLSVTASEKDSDNTYESDDTSKCGAESLLFDDESAESDDSP